jgi:hypothetical protein
MRVAEPPTFPDDGDDVYVQKVQESNMTTCEEREEHSLRCVSH